MVWRKRVRKWARECARLCVKDGISSQQFSDKKIDFKRMDGKDRKMRMTLLPLSDDKSENIGSLISFKDETELENLKKTWNMYTAINKAMVRSACASAFHKSVPYVIYELKTLFNQQGD